MPSLPPPVLFEFIDQDWPGTRLASRVPSVLNAAVALMGSRVCWTIVIDPVLAASGPSSSPGRAGTNSKCALRQALSVTVTAGLPTPATPPNAYWKLPSGRPGSCAEPVLG